MAPAPRSLKKSLLRFYKLTHERLLKAADETPPGQFAWSAGITLHSVAWQLWHAARWDDVIASFFHRTLKQEPLTQVWERESLTARWSLTPDLMGLRNTGTKMSDEAAEEMRFPGKDEVIGYARLAFAYAEAAIDLIAEDRLLAVASGDPDGDSYLDNVFIYLEHLSRHLGVIEAIRGLQS